MLASTESGTHQFTMADDSMEISSEHGHNVGDDIDIDIDLTTGQADEDYVLQDALSGADYSNGFLPQLSLEMHHDDVMVDDDNESYQMEDADLIHDETEEIIETEVAMADPFQMLNADDGNTVAYTEEHDIGLFFNQQEGHDETLVGDGLQDSGNISHHEENVPASEDMVPHDDALPTDESTFQEVEGVGKGESHHQSQDSTPPSHSPAAAPEEPGSPPTSIPGPDPPVVTHESNDAIPEPDHSSSHEDSAKSDEPSSAERTYDLSNAYAMKVVYQSVEYALFSTSESDDPDSFFLSDIAIMEKPLSDLFKAIREIIHDDLAEEDELCLSFEDLGLETEEASIYIQDITLARILTLYESLLRNDGIDSARPLYLVLGTKMNFRSRFLNLHQGASQGKGLSELVVWDKNSESLEDLEDGYKPTNGVESNLMKQETTRDSEDKQGIEDKNKENGPTAKVSVEFHEEEQQTEREEDPEEQVERAREEEHEEGRYEVTQPEENQPASVPEDSAPAPTEHTHESDVANVKIKSQGGSPQQPTTEATHPTNPITSTEVDAANGEDDEEDDLIDYSDEEIQHQAEERRTSVVADENRTDTEYQAKEEELRRRSISRQAEERRLEQSLDQTYGDTDDSNQHEEYFDGNETAYDDYSTAFHGNQSDGYEFVEHTRETNPNNHEEQNSGFDGHENFKNDEVTYERNPETGADGYDDINEESTYQTFEEFDDEETGSQGLPAYAEETASHEVSDFVEVNGQEAVREHPAPSTASSLGAAETTESSVTLGAEDMGYEDNLDEEISNELKELENATTPTNGSNLEQKDEIDYEDDEEEELPISSGPGAVAATKELPNANGKRSIEEVESVISTPSKDAKRPRS